MIDIFKKWVVQFAAWLSPKLSKIHSPWSRKLILSSDYRDFKRRRFPAGTVLTSATNGEISNMFISGDWKHIAIYDGDENVIEATTHNVSKTDLIDFFMKKDFVAAYIPTFASLREMEFALAYSYQQLGKPYDFKFASSDIKAFYCAELIFSAYNASVKESPFKLKSRLGQMTILPSDVPDAKDKWNECWRSKSYKG